MTAQEIYEREGFLIYSSHREYQIGAVVENFADDAIVPRGTKLVVITTVSVEEALAVARRSGYDHSPAQYLYKVIAE